MTAQITKYSCEQLDGVKLSCLVVKGEPWFCGVEVAKALGYEKPRQTVWKMDLKYKNTFQLLLSMLGVSSGETQTTHDSNSSWINEAGLYKLILKSTLKSAEIFQDWVTSEVLPSIRKTGQYITKPQIEAPLVAKQIKLLNETDLHYKVVDLIRNKFPDLIIVPGLGENQTTVQLRSDAFHKGYVGGQPDLLILNRSDKHNGFAIELKTPKGNGDIRVNQLNYLVNLENNLNYKTMISNDYDEIVIELTKYYDSLRYPCSCCSKVFKSKKALDGHTNMFHKN
jgi:prophage antirepressor-like protein